MCVYIVLLVEHGRIGHDYVYIVENVTVTFFFENTWEAVIKHLGELLNFQEESGDCVCVC